MRAFAEQLGLLRAPAGGGGEFLVDAGLEHDIGLRKLPLRLPELHVEAAERRAAVAGNEASSVEAGAAVALALHQKHAHDGLRPGQENALLAKVELVVERDVMQRHQAFPLRRHASDRAANVGVGGRSLSSLAGEVKQNRRGQTGRNKWSG